MNSFCYSAKNMLKFTNLLTSVFASGENSEGREKMENFETPKKKVWNRKETRCGLAHRCNFIQHKSIQRSQWCYFSQLQYLHLFDELFLVQRAGKVSFVAKDKYLWKVKFA